MRLIPQLVSSAGRGAFRLCVMELALEPEPEPEEREVVTLALTRLLAREQVPPAYRSAWREAGVAANLADYATARPRSNPGATRA
jgi:hypothetical protein